MGVKVIGAVGHIGSGKDEALKYLSTMYGIPFLSTGDMVRKIAAERGLELTRENLQAVSEAYFREKGKGCFVRMAGEEIIKKGWKTAGISGIRAPADANILRELFKQDFILLNIQVTDPLVRFDRLLLRNHERDPHTYEDFEKQNSNEEAIFKINETISMADFTITNDGTLAEFQKQIDALVKSKKILVL